MTTQEERDLAVIARLGGNLYRRAFQSPGEGWAWKAGPRLDGYVRDDAESLFAGRSYLRGGYSPPYHSDTYSSPAAFHGLTHHMSERPDSRAMLPESAFDWPIYRAAMLRCVPPGDGTLGPSMDVSRAVKDHLDELRDGYPCEFDEWMGERFPKGFGPA